MFSKLSPKQEEVLNFIITYLTENGYPPSIRDIGRFLGISSSGTVSLHLDALVAKGYIMRNPNIPRGIKVLLKPNEPEKRVKIAIVGEISAGRPIFAEESFDDAIEVEQSRIPRARKVYALRVKGDSMIGEKIFNGDIVLIAEQSHAENGDIVVALLDNEATLKKFHKVGSYIALLPANPDYDPIPVIEKEHNLLIQGKFVGKY